MAIVARVCELEIKLAFVALLRVNEKVSSGSTTVSPVTWTVAVAVVVLGENVMVPVFAT